MSRLNLIPKALQCMSLIAVVSLSPVQVKTFVWAEDRLITATLAQSLQLIPPLNQADLSGDGRLEELMLQRGVLTIQHDQVVLWTSPPDWEVSDAQITDLDRDQQPEVTLLVWRPFQPWPIDAYIPSPGRIQDFHNRQGRSCHIILIVWRKDAFVERWAGSALADPLLAFRATDLDGDDRQELVALESRYDSAQPMAEALTVWEWNGFGFTLLWRDSQGRYTDLRLARATGQGPDLLIVQGISRR